MSASMMIDLTKEIVDLTNDDDIYYNDDDLMMGEDITDQFDFSAWGEDPFGINEFEPEPEPELEPEIECCICHEDFSTAKTTKLKCGHIYHVKCLRKWSKKKKECPMDRKPFKICELKT